MAETGFITAAWAAGSFIFLAAVCGIWRARRYSKKTKMAQVTQS